MKTDPKQPQTDPHHSETDTHERHISGNIHVRGEIETKLPPDLIEKYDTEREHDTARDNKRFVVEIGTLVLVAIYAAVAAWQGCSAQKTADSTVIDRRPYVIVKNPRFLKPAGLVPDQPLQTEVTVTNIGRTPAISANSSIELVHFAHPQFTPGEYAMKAQKIFLDETFTHLTKNEWDGRVILTTLSAERDIAPGEGGEYFSVNPNPLTLTRPDIADINSTDMLAGGLFFVGLITYTDREAPTHPYKTEFCWYYLGEDQTPVTETWRRCRFHNTIR